MFAGDLQLSLNSHWKYFREREYDVQLFGRVIDPELCTLKEYQDLLIFAFISEHIPPGSKILDIGGGNSRILKFFQNDYDCWNLDKFEGQGNGPLDTPNCSYQIVREYLGNFSPELEDHSFDFVFSISALEHVPDNPELHQNILKDLLRLLKPEAPSLHCFDCLLSNSEKSTNWTSGLLPYLYQNHPSSLPFIQLENLEQREDIYGMNQASYDRYWKKIVKKDYFEFGKVFSYQFQL